MPNHVENIISLSGSEQEIQQMLKRIKSDMFGVGTVDFEKIIPMPESLNIESGTRTDRGLRAYRDFIEVYTFGRSAKDALKALEDTLLPTDVPQIQLWHLPLLIKLLNQLNAAFPKPYRNLNCHRLWLEQCILAPYIPIVSIYLEV